MAGQFTWERGPFEQCPKCGQNTFGILGAGDTSIRRRCTECRYSHNDLLPPLSKKAIYLDQFAFSAVFQIEAKGRPLGKHQAFWEEAHHLMRRLVLLQQIVLPHSDVHHSETVVSPFPQQLRDCYEHFGGDARLIDTENVLHAQTNAYAKAYIDGDDPKILYEPQTVMDRKIDRWLNDMQISVGMDYSQFADGHRQDLDRVATAMEGLIEGWAASKPTFSEILERELGAFASSRRGALAHFSKLIVEAIEKGDVMSAVNYRHNQVFSEIEILEHYFQKNSAIPEEVASAINQFWEWPRNRERPDVLIFSYLLAALARKVVAGQKKVSRGFLNDVKIISTYAPYLDAMFLDNECATLLAEKPLTDDLNYRARIFSLNNKDEFIFYLRGIEEATPDDVRTHAALIYGVS